MLARTRRAVRIPALNARRRPQQTRIAASTEKLSYYYELKLLLSLMSNVKTNRRWRENVQLDEGQRLEATPHDQTPEHREAGEIRLASAIEAIDKSGD